jgi:glucose/arabinose dehydrogenase
MQHRIEMIKRLYVTVGSNSNVAENGIGQETDHAAILYADGMLIGEHGSWNRKPPSGHKVIFVPFSDGRPAGQPLDVLSGFLDAKGNARGRPVGVAIDGRGALLVADDVGNAVWRVTAR